MRVATTTEQADAIIRDLELDADLDDYDHDEQDGVHRYFNSNGSWMEVQYDGTVKIYNINGKLVDTLIP